MAAVGSDCSIAAEGNLHQHASRGMARGSSEVRTEITNPLQEILKWLAHMKHGWTFQQSVCLSINSAAVWAGPVNKRIIRSSCSPGHKAANDTVRQVQLGALRKLV